MSQQPKESVHLGTSSVTTPDVQTHLETRVSACMTFLSCSSHTMKSTIRRRISGFSHSHRSYHRHYRLSRTSSSPGRSPVPRSGHSRLPPPEPLETRSLGRCRGAGPGTAISTATRTGPAAPGVFRGHVFRFVQVAACVSASFLTYFNRLISPDRR